MPSLKFLHGDLQSPPPFVLCALAPAPLCLPQSPSPQLPGGRFFPRFSAPLSTFSLVGTCAPVAARSPCQGQLLLHLDVFLRLAAASLSSALVLRLGYIGGRMLRKQRGKRSLNSS